MWRSWSDLARPIAPPGVESKVPVTHLLVLFHAQTGLLVDA